MKNSAEQPRGVIVIADYHSHLPPAIEVAIALANRRRLALRGLYIEDPDLACVSSLPFIQEVTLLSARPRSLEQERLRRTLETFSRRFQQLLSEGAEQAALNYSYERVPERGKAIDLGVALNPDYLVLGQPRPTRQRGRGALRVLLLQPNMQAALPVLESLLSLGNDRPLELLLANGHDQALGDEQLQKLVAEHREVSCQSLPPGQLVQLFRQAGHSPDLVITSRRCDPAVREKVLQLATCPVILSN